MPIRGPVLTPSGTAASSEVKATMNSPKVLYPDALTSELNTCWPLLNFVLSMCLVMMWPLKSMPGYASFPRLNRRANQLDLGIL